MRMYRHSKAASSPRRHLSTRGGIARFVVAAAILSWALPIHPAAAAANGPSADSPCDGSTQRAASISVSTQGGTYSVRLRLPAGYDGRDPSPVLINLHGSTQSGAQYQQILTDWGLDEVADRYGVVMAYPDGGIPASQLGGDTALERGNFWNMPGESMIAGVPDPPGSRDDVAFIAALIEAMTTELCVDPRRVYASGLSGGARMISGIACTDPYSQIAAFAPIAGVRAGNSHDSSDTTPDPATCQPGRPVSLVAFHGEQDELDTYHGGSTEPAYGLPYNWNSNWTYGVPAAMQRWAEIDGCRTEPVTTRVTETVMLDEYPSCRSGARVWLYRSLTDGHVMPTWDGTPDAMWQFLSHNTLNP